MAALYIAQTPFNYWCISAGSTACIDAELGQNGSAIDITITLPMLKSYGEKQNACLCTRGGGTKTILIDSSAFT